MTTTAETAITASFDMSTIEYKGKTYEASYGTPFSRGTVDSYYGRPRVPNYIVRRGTSSNYFYTKDMTAEQIEAYNAGYSWNEEFGSFKDYE